MADRIEFNLIKKLDNGETIKLTALETVNAISTRFVNGWIADYNRTKCKLFSGTEEDAAKIVKEIEDQCTSNYHMWQMFQ